MTTPVKYIDRTRAYYSAQGFAPYTWAESDHAPFTTMPLPLAQARLGLITTAALHDRAAGEPRAVTSAPTQPAPARLFANDLSWDKNATHMDDRESYLPINALNALVDEGVIGSIAPRLHCAPTEYSHRRTLVDDAPEILRRCREDNVDVALLVPI